MSVKVNDEWLQENGKYKCPHCEKEYTKKGIGTHIWRMHGDGIDFKSREKGCVPWNKGLTEDTDKRVYEMSNKVREGYRSGRLIPSFKGKHHTEENKQRFREIINQRYLDGWQPVCGRCPKYDYSSSIAGDIKVDGSWELAVCVYLDSINVTWKRNVDRFSYINLENTSSTYCPDFWVDEWDSYIEVKGYKTDLDDCKWSQFTKNLLIWDKPVLESMGILK